MAAHGVPHAFAVVLYCLAIRLRCSSQLGALSIRVPALVRRAQISAQEPEAIIITLLDTRAVQALTGKREAPANYLRTRTALFGIAVRRPSPPYPTLRLLPLRTNQSCFVLLVQPLPSFPMSKVL